MLRRCGGWRWAEHVTRNAVIPCAKYLNAEEVKDVLLAWRENGQCRTASGMLALSIQFFDAVDQLSPRERIELFTTFIAEVRLIEGEYSGFRYSDLTSHVAAIKITP